MAEWPDPLSPREIGARLIVAILGAVIAGLILAYLIGDWKPTNGRSTPVLSQERLPISQNSPNSESAPANAERTPQSQPITQSLLGASTSQDLSGEWNLLDTVDSTSYLSYTNMQVGFRLSVNQVGSKFTADGEKYWLNGRELSYSERTAIHITGSIEGESIVATFVEDGIRRKSKGTFTWKIENGGRGLRGRFMSTAANSSGE